MITLIHGECIEKMRELPDNSVDSIVTDPPYKLGFMGKSWDSTGIANNKEMWAECLRVLKHGGHLLAFSGTRAYHRMASAIEDAGFEVRDMIEWVYGSGFPKSLNIGKAVDKRPRALEITEKLGKIIKQYRTKKGYNLRQLGELCDEPLYKIGGTVFFETPSTKRVPTKKQWDKLKEVLEIPTEYDELFLEAEREVVGKDGRTAKDSMFGIGIQPEWEITKGTSEWEGWGTALKPAHEPICMARKPLAEKTVAENCLKWGTGGINIDESRVGTEKIMINGGGGGEGTGWGKKEEINEERTGRFPANLIHDNSEEVRECFPNESERFFKSIIYQAKASKSERNKGCENLDDKLLARSGGAQGAENEGEEEYLQEHIGLNRITKVKNNHPTVKPIALMEYLIKMITPKGGVVLDPFMGSGSTGVACKNLNYGFIGIEMEEDYITIAKNRIENIESTLF